MSASTFPLVFGSEDVYLLTAIALGFLFGFSLERGGFGNARKLAAQFYFYDMTVFKVMFTAILVAMVGMYTLVGIGWVDLSRMWINPTFLWGQLVGGFLLGAGFIMSGLCPGTSVVSAASGRIDAVVTFVGIFIGVFLFTLTVDWFPWVHQLYTSGSLGVSVLPQLLGLPAPLFALLVVVMAGVAFAGAEKVERMFATRHPPVELTPTGRPRVKFALAGVASLAAAFGLLAAAPQPAPPPIAMQPMAPLALGRAIIAKDPNILILDVRAEAERGDATIPGATPVAPDSTALTALNVADAEMTVVLFDQSGALKDVPSAWPRQLRYRYLRGGFEGWQHEVLTPVDLQGKTGAEREAGIIQNQIAGYFSGAKVTPAAAAAPPPAMGAGAPKKKKTGGC